MKADRRGFALVLTIALVALLVLVLSAVGLVNRIGGSVALATTHEIRARQMALVGMDAAVAALQQAAGSDLVVTGMAGISGVTEGGGSPARHWCGVWDADGDFLRWLASGAPADGSIPPLDGADSVAMLANGSLGADAADKEHVRVLWSDATGLSSHDAVGLQGRYAWWIGDEGVKLSAVIAGPGAPTPGGFHGIDELIPSLSPGDPVLANVQAYGQLALVPTPPLTPGPLQANFHALTVTHVGLDPLGARRPGVLNVNTSSERFWRGVAATYNLVKAADAPSVDPGLFADWMHTQVALVDVAADKPAGSPYRDVTLFLAGDALAGAVAAGGGDVAPFATAMAPWLAARSDTFRVRAAGRSLNVVDPSQIEAEARCEAILQRSATPLAGFGRRFVVTSFRWLGPDDI